MMKKKGLGSKVKGQGLVFFIFYFFFFTPSTLYPTPYYCYAQLVSSNELIEKAKEYNNKIVEFQGEVIGDVMARGDYAWINLKDGLGAIGVFCRKDLISQIVKCKGNYNCKGDILQVKGVFHRACPQHGGDLDIHMYEAVKLKEGFRTPHEVSFPKIVAAFSLTIIALGLSILSAFKTRER